VVANDIFYFGQNIIMARKKNKNIERKIIPAQGKETEVKNKGVIIYWILLALLILFITIIRLRILNVPLERDEGEYAYMGQLLLKGHPPFELAYNMKYPGTSMMYAFFMLLFGQTAAGVHAGLLLVNVISILLVFLLGKKLFNPLVALVASTSFALLTISTALIGSAAHATHCVTVFALAGIYLILLSNESERKKMFLFLGGLLLGAAIVMKQPGLLLATFGFLFAAWQEWKGKDKIKRWAFHLILVGLGIVLPVAMLFLWMYAAGTFDRFWFWTYEYGNEYALMVKWDEAKFLLNLFWKGTSKELGSIWLLAGIGLIGVWSKKHLLSARIFIVGFFVFALLAVSPGFYFRGHYFVMLAPAIGLLAGVGVDFFQWLMRERFRLSSVQWIAPVLFVFASIAGIAKMKSYLFEKTPDEISQMIYGSNPFIQSKVIGEYIQKNSSDTSKIAVLGSEPQICFYADRISASGYLYTYNLMEPQPFNEIMQEEMIEEIENANPEILLYVKSKLSWMMRPESPTNIFEWFEKYVQNFELTGLVELPAEGHGTRYHWSPDATKMQPPEDDVVFIFRRKGS